MPPLQRQPLSKQPHLSSTWDPQDQISQYPELRSQKSLRFASEEVRDIAELPERRPLILKKKSKLGSIARPHVKNLAPTLAYLRGEINTPKCMHCQSFVGPFPECVSLPGHFDLACTNCAYNEHGARCSFRGNFQKRPSESLRTSSLAARESRRRSRSRSRSSSPVKRDMVIPRERSPRYDKVTNGHDIWRPAPVPSVPAGQFETRGVARSHNPLLSERVTKITPTASLANRQPSPPRQPERSWPEEWPRQYARASVASNSVASSGRRELRDMPALTDDVPPRSVSPTKISPSWHQESTASDARRELKDMPALTDDVRPRSEFPATAPQHGTKRYASVAFQDDAPTDGRHVPEDVRCHSSEAAVDLSHAGLALVSHGENVPSAIRQIRIAALMEESERTKELEQSSKAKDANFDQSLTEQTAKAKELEQDSTRKESSSSNGQPAAKKQKVIPEPSRSTPTVPLTIPPGMAARVINSSYLVEQPTTEEVTPNPAIVTALCSSDVAPITTEPIIEEPLMAPWHRKSPNPPQNHTITPELRAQSNKGTVHEPQITISNHVSATTVSSYQVPVNTLDSSGSGSLNDHMVTVDPLLTPTDITTGMTDVTKSTTPPSKEVETLTAEVEVELTPDPLLSRYDEVLAEVMALTQQQQYAEMAVLLFRMSALQDALSRHSR